MRLIDADDLIKAFEALDLMNGQYAESSNMAGNRSMEIESAIKQEREIFKYSNCGNYLDFRGVNAGRGDANYCPNCGEKMDDEN